jgi:hypothetical protein
MTDDNDGQQQQLTDINNDNQYTTIKHAWLKGQQWEQQGGGGSRKQIALATISRSKGGRRLHNRTLDGR